MAQKRIAELEAEVARLSTLNPTGHAPARSAAEGR
jgi:uncharacterized small protein (DUF1192 family)